VKLGCCETGLGTAALPPLVEPPKLPLLVEDGDGHGLFGVGSTLLDGIGEPPVGDAVAAGAPGAGAVGVMWPGMGSGDAVEVGLGDELAVGDTLDSRPHTSRATGDPLGLGLGEEPIGDAVGRSAGFGPRPPSAKAVAATEASTATLVAVSAAVVLRDIDPPPSPVDSPTRRWLGETDIRG
jgi:hypothetical protein